MKRVEASVQPTTAKQGDTVTWRLTVETAPGWHTYPTTQPDANAAAFVNKISFPNPGPVTFTGALTEPADPAKMAEPAAGIKELRYYPGTAVWTRKATIPRDAASGQLTIAVPVKVRACDNAGCLPPRTVQTRAAATVAADPPVPTPTSR